MSESREKTKVLVVDDEEGVRHYLRLLLTREGFEVVAAADAQEALKQLRSGDPDIMLCDIRMPGELDGLGLLEVLQEQPVRTEVVMMSAYGSRETALEAVRRGAYDYIDKPIQQDDLLLTLHKLLERKRLQKENRKLKEVLREAREDGGIVAKSESLEKLIRQAKRVATFPTAILIQGETGTGKGLLAQAIHQWSDRRDKPLVEVNCAAIPENLLESELFGYAKGAFTGANRDYPGLIQSAHGSTLVLDEIGELPLPLQVKLLRVLEEGLVRRLGEVKAREIDVRFIAATNRDLEREVEAGRFRRDLFHRINVFTCKIPPLRERQDDVPLLIETYIERVNTTYKTAIEGVEPKAMKALMHYSWEGNVRELRNAIESAIVQSAGPLLTLDDLPSKIVHYEESSSPAAALAKNEIFLPEELISIKEASRELEWLLIKRALARTQGNKSAAARLLEISSRTLSYKLQEFEEDGRSTGY